MLDFVGFCSSLATSLAGLWKTRADCALKIHNGSRVIIARAQVDFACAKIELACLNSGATVLVARGERNREI